jgi:hypothetical protein
MKHEPFTDLALRRFRENAEAIRTLTLENDQIRRMLTTVGITPVETSESPSATVIQLRVVSQPQLESSSMREMVRTALKAFPGGATKAQLIEFIEKSWQQEINAASLSVMLTTMRKSLDIERAQGVWRLAPRAQSK